MGLDRTTLLRETFAIKVDDLRLLAPTPDAINYETDEINFANEHGLIPSQGRAIAYPSAFQSPRMSETV